MSWTKDRWSRCTLQTSGAVVMDPFTQGLDEASAARVRGWVEVRVARRCSSAPAPPGPAVSVPSRRPERLLCAQAAKPPPSPYTAAPLSYSSSVAPPSAPVRAGAHCAGAHAPSAFVRALTAHARTPGFRGPPANRPSLVSVAIQGALRVRAR